MRGLSLYLVPVRPRRLWISVLILVLALTVGSLLLWGSWTTPVLEIRAGEGGRLVKTISVEPGERITYSYLHSVQKRRVDEVMEVTPDAHLVVRETVYDMYGAGLPSDTPDGTFLSDPESGKFRITDMSRDIPTLRVRVAFTAEQTLAVRGNSMRLDSLASPTTLLVVDVAVRPRIALLLR